MNRKTGMLLLAGALGAGYPLGGCARVNPRPDYERAAARIERATGHAETYRPGEDERVAARLMEIVKDGITADEAAQIALLNNPKLQSAFYEIGIARADVVQSGPRTLPNSGSFQSGSAPPSGHWTGPFSRSPRRPPRSPGRRSRLSTQRSGPMVASRSLNRTARSPSESWSSRSFADPPGPAVNSM